MEGGVHDAWDAPIQCLRPRGVWISGISRRGMQYFVHCDSPCDNHMTDHLTDPPTCSRGHGSHCPCPSMGLC